MKLNQQKQQKHPLSAVREKRIRPMAIFLQNKEVSQGFQDFESRREEEKIKQKHRGRSGKSNRYSNMKIGVSQTDTLGKDLKSKRTYFEEGNGFKRKVESTANCKIPRRGSANKKLLTEFQKQLYWNNGNQAYMISGVKLQYQKMKEDYVKKSEEYQNLIRSAVVVNNVELLFYVDLLEAENRALAKQNNDIRIGHRNGHEEYSSTKTVQIQGTVAKQQKMIQALKQNIRKRNGAVKTLTTKINFLEKLLITKDNNEHAALVKCKKLEKDKTELQFKLGSLQNQMDKEKINYQQQLDELQKFHQKKLAEEIGVQIAVNSQQAGQIERLQRENTYLQNLVDCWKQQKKPKKLRHQQSNISRGKIEKINSEISEKSPLLKANKKQQIVDNRISFKNEQDENSSLEDNLVGVRIPYSELKKNSEQSVKNRRVQAYEIEELIQFARYILISKSRNVEWVTALFQHWRDEWSKQYINLLEVRTIFQDNFGLTPRQSLLLGRYVIEHSQAEFVYTDDLNEHHREVVKSIVKNLLGSYQTFEDRKEEFEEVLKTSRSKLEWVLQSVTKEGCVDRQKFRGVAQNLGLNLNEDFITYCVAKMLEGSQNIQRLKYGLLFDGPACEQ